MDGTDELGERARRVIDANRYLTLGTTEPDHRPRLSPVYYTHVGYRDFYWVSSPEAHHSVNIAARQEIAIVIFDSTAPVGQGKAVYISAKASVIADEDLPAHCAVAFTRTGPDAARSFAPHELNSDADLRLYHARATTYELHVPGSDPKYGTGIDTRRPVTP
jgi:hypothetical protein